MKRWAAAAAAVAAACAMLHGEPAGAVLGAVRTIPFPAVAKSGEPSLSVDPAGNVHAVWFEARGESRHALRIAKLTGSRWSAPRTIVEGDSFFVNWADTPILLARGGGRLAVSYPWKSGAGTYAYDVRISQSFDDGKTWGAPVTPHRDGTPTEHGFVSLLDEGDGVRAVWLDGRKAAAQAAAGGHGGHGDEHGAEMTLRTALLDARGRLDDEAMLDERVCDCCPTAAARAGDDVVVVYRDRSENEIRDMSLVRASGGRWSTPRPLHADGWKMPACPVNGPSLDAVGDRIAAVWYSEAGDRPMVYFARSNDGGRTFSTPVAVADTSTLGRTGVLVRPDGAALVSWLDQVPGAARLLVREIAPNGAMRAPIEVARTSFARSSGVPRMVRAGARVVIAWTDVAQGRAARVQSAVVDWR